MGNKARCVGSWRARSEARQARGVSIVADVNQWCILVAMSWFKQKQKQKPQARPPPPSIWESFTAGDDRAAKNWGTKPVSERAENAATVGTLGAAVGGAIGGPPGVAIGTAIGAFLGYVSGTNERKR